MPSEEERNLSIHQQIGAEIVRGAQDIQKAAQAKKDDLRRELEHEMKRGKMVPEEIKITVNHELRDDGKHRLVVEPIGSSEWIEHTDVACFGSYRAIHPHNPIKGLPKVFKIVEGVESVSFVGGVR